MSIAKSPAFLRSLKVAVAVLILASLIYHVDARELIRVLKNLTIESALWLFLISVALIYISALKWSYFLTAFGTRIKVLTLFNFYLVGYFVNLVLPSYLGGDAVRSWYAGKKSGQHEALAATVLERYTGLVAMVFLAMLFMWNVPAVTFQIKCAVILIATGILVFTILALSAQTLSLVKRMPYIQAFLPHFQKIQDALNLARKDPILLGKSLVLSLIYHSVTVLNTMAAAYAVGWWDPPIQELFVVLPLILLIGSIPVTPGGLGVQEGAFYYFLHAVGATGPQAIGVALILRAKGYVIALLGGLAWLKVRRDSIE